ncbi:ectonucleotide pyrophosphatase/phosphodiesterase [uncultured Sphaerochaeta sp.]|uniref:alkaline phosphatase family protein n=1 Tax=uncultured Sphaerochaeta sp. TaxID=886478 RepID=UPI002A0A6D31|nr:ectonucleotide pyrophosphatase/phosphodiesterase [uncultured Sphaerochaeta sp.]
MEKRRLFVLSIDALFDEDLGFIQKACPNLNEILKRSSKTQGMISTYPAMTYVAHSSIITGCYPNEHGIAHNEHIEVGKAHPRWNWYRKDLKRDSIFDAAHKANYSTCAINWPVTGADPNIDYNIPEIWSDLPSGCGRERFLSICSPGAEKLYDKYCNILRWKNQPELDIFGICCLLDIIKEHQPEVIFLHLSQLDHSRHSTGPYSDTNKRSLEEIDFRFGKIANELKKLELYDKTDFIVLGDHGHIAVSQIFNPNILMINAGLIKLDSQNNIVSWDCYCHSAGLSCHVVLSHPENDFLRERVIQVLDDIIAHKEYGCSTYYTVTQLKEKFHLENGIDFSIESEDGTSFGNSCFGKLIDSPDNTDYKFSISGHGHDPSRGPMPAFYAAGPHIKEGLTLPKARLIDEAPTFAMLLNINMPKVQGNTLRQLIK